MKNLLVKNYLSSLVHVTDFILALLTIGVIFLFSNAAFSQTKCGGLNQRPCQISEKTVPCKKGLREDFRTDKCVSAQSLAQTSYLKLCNSDAQETISFIVVLWDSSAKKWAGEGWYRIEDYECTVITLSGSYQGYVNIYAEMKGKTWTGKAGSFCAPTDLNQTFRNFDRQNCRAPYFKRVELFSVLLEPRVSKTHYLKS